MNAIASLQRPGSSFFILHASLRNGQAKPTSHAVVNFAGIFEQSEHSLFSMVATTLVACIGDDPPGVDPPGVMVMPMLEPVPVAGCKFALTCSCLRGRLPWRAHARVA